MALFWLVALLLINTLSMDDLDQQAKNQSRLYGFPPLRFVTWNGPSA